MTTGIELKYGVCDCEYPCSCVEFEDQMYGSWKEIIEDLVQQRDDWMERYDDLLQRVGGVFPG